MSGKCYQMRLEGDTCLYVDGHGPAEKGNIMICRKERERKDKANDAGEREDILMKVSMVTFWPLSLIFVSSFGCCFVCSISCG